MKFWTQKEYDLLEAALLKHGKDWDLLAKEMPSISRKQILQKMNSI
jgi:hypothetical protein